MSLFVLDSILKFVCYCVMSCSIKEVFKEPVVNDCHNSFPIVNRPHSSSLTPVPPRSRYYNYFLKLVEALRDLNRNYYLVTCITNNINVCKEIGDVNIEYMVVNIFMYLCNCFSVF